MNRRAPLAGIAIAFAVLSGIAAVRVRFPHSRILQDTISAARLAGHLETLADDANEGRFPGDPGYERAANYVAEQFRQLGLVTLDGAPDFRQPVSLRLIRLVPEASQVWLEIDGRILPIPRDLHMIPPSCAHERLHAARVFRLNSFSGVRLDESVRECPEVQPDESPPLCAADDPFASILTLFQRPNCTSVTNAPVLGVQADSITLFGFPERRTASGPSRLGQLESTSLCLLDETGSPGNKPLEPSGKNTSAVGLSLGLLSRIQTALEDTASPSSLLGLSEPSRSLTLRLAAGTLHDTIRSWNMVGSLPGQGARANEAIVVMAHLDHIGKAEGSEGDQIFNGAIDNASGVAMLLEVARALVVTGTPRPRTILFLATTAEEAGLLGARAFLNSSLAQRYSLVGTVNLDSIAMRHPLTEVVLYGVEKADWGPALKRSLTFTGLRATGDPWPEMGFLGRSDQLPFLERKIPALMPLGGPETGTPHLDGKALDDEWMNSIYHTPEDEAGQPIDWEATAHLTWFIATLIDSAARQDARPTFHET